MDPAKRKLLIASAIALILGFNAPAIGDRVCNAAAAVISNE